MAKEIEKLTQEDVATLTKPGFHGDGLGLYLQVSVWGTKSWVLRYTRHQKAHTMGLGPAHTISLLEARKRARKARQQLLDGVDPIQAKRQAVQDAKAKQARMMTFEQCAKAYISAHKAGWKNAKHADQWTNTLETYAYPIIGKVDVAAVDTTMVLKVLEPVWSEKNETASRVRGRMESILDWATVRKHRHGDNPARWRGHLDKLLPKPTKVQKVEHHAALPYKRMGEFMDELHKRQGMTALALEFVILTACRTSEVINAPWTEIDLEASVWTIPPERMKAEKEHRVPLSIRAVEILNELKTLGGKYVFPGPKPDKPMSNMAMLQLLKRMGRDDLTVHGFRSTFRDWAAEQTAYPAEVAEMALAHTVGNKVEAAYRRGDLFMKRVRIMQDWGRYCATPSAKTGEVAPIRGAA